MATKPKDDDARAPKPSFDERLAALDQLVLEIEGGKLGLEASMQRYQDGMRLYQELKGEIEAHRKRFQELAADGGLVTAKDGGPSA